MGKNTLQGRREEQERGERGSKEYGSGVWKKGCTWVSRKVGRRGGQLADCRSLHGNITVAGGSSACGAEGGGKGC